MTQTDPSIRSEIERRLDAIEAEEGVRLLLAVESGSRAWGFPSPDSDYDVRFIYVRPMEDYVTLRERRDVIERPIVDEIDLNGWDLRKALNLMLKSNAVVSEWLESPIYYRSDQAAIEALKALANRALAPILVTHHYLRLARRQYERLFDGKDVVPLKKYFYVLRPALALRCLRLFPEDRVPMNLHEMIARSSLEEDLSRQIDELVAKKAVTHELGNGPRMADIDALVTAELQDAEARTANMKKKSGRHYDEAEALFQRIVFGRFRGDR